MNKQELHFDLDNLVRQLSTLKLAFDNAIASNKSFIEVKSIHLQIKELSRLIDILHTQQASPESVSNAGHKTISGVESRGTNGL